MKRLTNMVPYAMCILIALKIHFFDSERLAMGSSLAVIVTNVWLTENEQTLKRKNTN